MSEILPIILSPDPILNKTSTPVEKVDDALRGFMDDMLKTMYNASGIGLAAVQVGELKRILTIDTSYEIEDDHDHDHDHHGGCCGEVKVKNCAPIYMVNPKITEESKELYTYREGCLSFPEAYSEVERPQRVKVKFLDYNGREQIREFEGILAVCVQHEIDHLDGITFVDHISRAKREIIMKKLLKKRKSM